MEDKITLISQTFEKDELKQQIPIERSNDVWARIESVSRSEWRDAGMQGLKAELVAVMPFINYCGETVARFKNVRYAVYRTYHNLDTDEIELYLSREVGV